MSPLGNLQLATLILILATFMVYDCEAEEVEFTVPPMIGGFSHGPGNNVISFPTSRLVVNPRMLTVPALNPALPLAISTAGPAPIAFPGTRTIQQAQVLYRNKEVLDAGMPAGTIPGSIVLTSQQTVGDINTLFGSTSQTFDLIAVEPPPASYTTAVDAVFQSGTTVAGVTRFNPTTSGALRSAQTEPAMAGDPINQALMAGDLVDVFYAYDYVASLAVPSPSADSLIGRSSVATHTTPIPHDRIYFDYSLVNNAVPIARRSSFSRFTLGLEKLLNEDGLSMEVRIPFAASLDHEFALENGMGADQTQMGNALVVLKQLLGANHMMAVSGGLGLSLPTGNNVDIHNLAGTPLLEFDNETTHFKPFLAAAIVPDEHWFATMFVEYDMAGGTNRVRLNLDGSGLQSVGRLRDSTHVLVDMSVGYWFHPHGSWEFIHKVAPIMELHFDRGLGDSTTVRGNSYRIIDISDDREFLNIVVGATLDLHEHRYVSMGYVTGLGGDGSQSDGEFRLSLNLPFTFK
ncbi:MAG: hypothetical protein H8E37_02945 [Planctomycetes bacterium]|nr:hypothetical protein [Planctomycetota bacterium]